LKALLEISKSLAGTLDLESMLPKILDTLFSIFKYADRGCILLKDPVRGEMVPRAMKHRRQGDDATVRLSRTVVRKVLEKKVGILSADASTDAAFDGSSSIADLKIRSMMCVPLLGLDGEPTGVLSIDSQNPLGQFSNEDLELLVTVAGQAALSYETARLVQSYTEKQKQDNELKIAQQVQRALLPTELPTAEGYEFFASYDAAQAVGGDYYDAFDLGEGRICLSFGDVAGKGVPGALIMSRMSSCVQSTLRHVQGVVEAICAINDHMCDTAVEGRFVTYILAIVDTKKHTVELSNAGHMSPIIRRASGRVEQFNDELVGTPIGVLEDYPYESETRSLEPGDLVVIVTDGVDEAMNPQGDLYTSERLLEFVKQGPPSADQLGKSLLADVRRHANGRPQNDDITIMTFGRK
jgi:serine phosphatase RsbU (regulator of sigma subunit)